MIHYGFHKRPPPDPILSQINPIHTLLPPAQSESAFTQLPYNFGYIPLSPSVKWPKHEADKAVKDAHSYTPPPLAPLRRRD